MNIVFSRFFLVLIVLFFTNFQISIAQKKSLLLDDLEKIYRIGTDVEVLEDISKELTIEDVRSEEFSKLFIPNQKATMNFGFSGSNYWFRCKIKTGYPDYQWVLHFTKPRFDSLFIYQFIENKLVSAHQLGTAFPNSPRPIYYHDYVVPLTMSQDNETTVYVFFGGKFSRQYPMEIAEQNIFYRDAWESDLPLLIMLGILSGLIFYNIFLFISIREKAYLYYVLHMACFSLLMINYNGLFDHYIPVGFNEFTKTALPVFICLTCYFGLLFTVSFLNTKSFFPKLYQYVLGFTYVILAGVFFVIIAFYQDSWVYILSLRFTSSLTMVTSILDLTIGLLTLSKRYRPARFYVIAWTFVLITTFLVGFNQLGLLEGSFLTAYAFQVGGVFEGILLSFGLADKINIERKQKLEAQTQMIQVLQKSEKEIQEKNSELEQKVKERTFEILQQKEELQQQAISLNETNQSKDKIFSIVAHDLRSPLASLKGIFNLLESKMLTAEEFFELFPELNKSLNNVFNLTEEVLYWARQQMQVIEIHPVQLNLSIVFKDQISRIENLASLKGVFLSYQTADDLSKVEADEDMIKSVLRNLINNAIKFSNKGGQVIVKAVNEEGFVKVTVSDTGIGIDPENISKVLGSENYTTRGTANEKGTGLGLTLCKDFVRRNGGKIWVESELGVGSHFHFTLPQIK